MVSPADRGEIRSGLPVPVFPAGLPAVEAGHGPGAYGLRESPAPPARRRLAIPALLIVGWGGLFAYCAAYLREDLPFRPAAPSPAGQRAEASARPTIVLPDLEDAPAKPTMRSAASAEERISAEPGSAGLASALPMPSPQTLPAPQGAPASPGVPAAPARAAAAPAGVEYAGTWGPTPAACGSPSRRRGYIPATITADRARAGRTLCTFHDGHRTGNAWTLAAECSDRGRRWSSQVRLVVEGDRLTWTSNRGSVSYTRCTRRAGLGVTAGRTGALPRVGPSGL